MVGMEAEVGHFSLVLVRRPAIPFAAIRSAMDEASRKVDGKVMPLPMASLTHRLLLQSRQCPSRIRYRASPRQMAQWQRPLSTTPRRCADEDNKEGSATAVDAANTSEESGSSSSKNWRNLPRADQDAHILSTLSEQLSALDPDVITDAVRKGKRGIPYATDFDLERDEDFEIEENDRRKTAAGFWAEGEESMGPDEDYFGDDITSHGHGELDKHRDLREYARLIAWELPLLSRTSTSHIHNSTHPLN